MSSLLPGSQPRASLSSDPAPSSPGGAGSAGGGAGSGPCGAGTWIEPYWPVGGATAFHDY